MLTLDTHLDPNDGTSNFTRSIPFWGVSLAYWRDGAPRLALLYFPALDRMYTATAGGGACRVARDQKAGEDQKKDQDQDR